MNYNHEQKLHHVRVNFRLPVLQSVGEILRTNNAILKRGLNSSKEPKPLENVGAPDRGKSGLLDGNRLFSNGPSYAGMGFALSVSVDFLSPTLWISPYSDYQQFLFSKIDQLHQEGHSYIKISKWMNEHNHLTPRGSVFKPNHAWSIHNKKRKSIERYARTFDPSIRDMSIQII